MIEFEFGTGTIVRNGARNEAGARNGPKSARRQEHVAKSKARETESGTGLGVRNGATSQKRSQGRDPESETESGTGPGVRNGIRILIEFAARVRNGVRNGAWSRNAAGTTSATSVTRPERSEAQGVDLSIKLTD